LDQSDAPVYATRGRRIAVDLWGWIEPVAKIFGAAGVRWLRRRRLRRALENPKFPEGRTLEALRRAIGEADTKEGQERTRELLRGVKRGAKRARLLRRTDLQAEEMWGLRPED
jgi:hypothetical protein